MPSILEFVKGLQRRAREDDYESTSEAQAQNLISEYYCPEIIKALEKQIPKTVKVGKNGHYCPECKRIQDAVNYHCWYCGQKLSWSEEE